MRPSNKEELQPGKIEKKVSDNVKSDPGNLIQ